MIPIELYFRFEKETKGAVRYKETTSEGTDLEYPIYSVGTIYIRKLSLVDKPFPDRLIVTIKQQTT